MHCTRVLNDKFLVSASDGMGAGMKCRSAKARTDFEGVKGAPFTISKSSLMKAARRNTVLALLAPPFLPSILSDHPLR